MITQPSKLTATQQSVCKHPLNHATQVAETKNGHKAHQKIQPHYTNEFNELETLQINS